MPACCARPRARCPLLGCALPREAWRLRARVGYLGHQALLYRELSAAENLRFHARLFGLPGGGAQRIAELLDAVELAHRAGTRVAEMSAGMLQRLAICRAVLHEPELLLLDEPYSHLDPAGAAIVEPLIGPAPGRTRVIVTHDVAGARADAGTILALGREGTAVYLGSAAAFGQREQAAAFAERTPSPAGRRGAGVVSGPAPEPRRGPGTLAVARLILAKDLRVELRTFESVPAMVLFATTIYVIFRFGLDRTELAGGLAAGVLLVTVLFAALLAINRIFVAEREQGGFEAIRLAPVDGTALLLAKAAALIVYLLALELVAVPIFAVFFLDGASGLLPLIPVLVLLDAGIAVTGALISSIATNSRARDLIAPLILLPLLVPLMIAAASAAENLLAAGGPSYGDYGQWLAVLALYDLVFLLIGYAVFDFLLED